MQISERHYQQSLRMKAWLMSLMTKDVKETDFPLSPILIAKYQGLDKTLKQKCTSKTNDNFSITKLEGVEVITYQGKICIPVQLQQRVVAWYHEYLAHPGESRTEATTKRTPIANPWIQSSELGNLQLRDAIPLGIHCPCMHRDAGKSATMLRRLMIGGRASQMRRVVHQDSIVSHISRPSNQHRHYVPSQFIVDAKDTQGNWDVLRQKMSLRCECDVTMMFHN